MNILDKKDSHYCRKVDLVTDSSRRLFVCKRIIDFKEDKARMDLQEVTSFRKINRREKAREDLKIGSEFLFAFNHYNSFCGLFYFVEDCNASEVVAVNSDFEKYLAADKTISPAFYQKLGKEVAQKFNKYIVKKMLSGDDKCLFVNTRYKDIPKRILKYQDSTFDSILILNFETKKKLMKLFPDSFNKTSSDLFFADVKVVEVDSNLLQNKIIMIFPELVYIHFKDVFKDLEFYEHRNFLRKIAFKLNTEILDFLKELEETRPPFYVEVKGTTMWIKSLLKVGLSFGKQGYFVFDLNH
jgi:hypothetical protein